MLALGLVATSLPIETNRLGESAPKTDLGDSGVALPFPLGLPAASWVPSRNALSTDFCAPPSAPPSRVPTSGASRRRNGLADNGRSTRCGAGTVSFALATSASDRSAGVTGRAGWGCHAGWAMLLVEAVMPLTAAGAELLGPGAGMSPSRSISLF